MSEPIVINNKATLSGLQLAHIPNVQEILKWNVNRLYLDIHQEMGRKSITFADYDLVISLTVQPKMTIKETDDEGD